MKAVQVAVLPVGWVGDWHESPAPQWVVALRGRWFIETQDGARVEMGPGDTHFGQDQGTAEIDGKHGHRSGQLGDEPCFQLLVQFAEPPTVKTRHPFGGQAREPSRAPVGPDPQTGRASRGKRLSAFPRSMPWRRVFG